MPPPVTEKRYALVLRSAADGALHSLARERALGECATRLEHARRPREASQNRSSPPGGTVVFCHVSFCNGCAGTTSRAAACSSPSKRKCRPPNLSRCIPPQALPPYTMVATPRRRTYRRPRRRYHRCSCRPRPAVATGRPSTRLPPRHTRLPRQHTARARRRPNSQTSCSVSRPRYRAATWQRARELGGAALLETGRDCLLSMRTKCFRKFTNTVIR